MEPDFLDGNHQSASATAWLRDIVLAIVVAAFCWTMTYVVTNAPRARAIAALQTAEEIGAESRTFCTKLNLAPESQLFITCMRELGHVRRNHEERVQRDLVGVF